MIKRLLEDRIIKKIESNKAILIFIEGIKNSAKMRDLLRLIAFQLGSEVSYEELGRQLGMSRMMASAKSFTFGARMMDRR